MRIPRTLQLWPDSATVHMYWRCHNREFYLRETAIKDLFINCLYDSLEYDDQKEDVKISAFCLMDNHVHAVTSYTNGSATLSNFMRYTHSLFGARFNKLKNRSGKVAEGRPKTPRIQNEYHAMRVHFYTEANPIRAKMRTLETLKLDERCSYAFYAYGTKTRYTFLLTPPDWYIRLGRTPAQRQKKYRNLFAEYLKDENKKQSVEFKKILIGDENWLFEASEHLIAMTKMSLALYPRGFYTFTDPPSSA